MAEPNFDRMFTKPEPTPAPAPEASGESLYFDSVFHNPDGPAKKGMMQPDYSIDHYIEAGDRALADGNWEAAERLSDEMAQKFGVEGHEKSFMWDEKGNYKNPAFKKWKRNNEHWAKRDEIMALAEDDPKRIEANKQKESMNKLREAFLREALNGGKIPQEYKEMYEEMDRRYKAYYGHY